jgi:predicted amidophosphoribosyltransferase
VPAGGSCRNRWCGREDRQFSAVWAIGAHTDTLRSALHQYKVDGNRAWAPVFGRLLVGFLDDHLPWFDDYDLIVGAPSYLGPGARRGWDPVAGILRAAAAEDGGLWPWDDGAEPALARTGECARMSALGADARRSHAESCLRRTIAVTRPERVGGRRVLVFDDVFTEGSTLRELARALRQVGAVEVAGLVLARQPWLSGPEERQGVRE